MATTITTRTRTLARPRLALVSILQPHWPAAAWLAHCHAGSSAAELMHGRHVEVTPEWFGEAVWTGPYSDGELDRTDLVFGSGGRVRGSTVTFVSAASTVDRLHSISAGNDVWVSNSLPCLLAATGARLDPTYPGYREDLRSIVLGLSRYQRTLPARPVAVRLTYFENLVWDGAELRVVPKPAPARNFATFDEYFGFLDETFAQFTANMADPARGLRYGLIGTLSSGYDSATIAAMAKRHGLEEVVTFASARSGEPDNGAEVAGVLGLRSRELGRDAWREQPLPEAVFLAADGKGEDTYFAAASDLLRGRVLLTGFHGDKLWDVETTALSPDIVRGDQSGLSLTEFRLRAGFVHLPVPFLGVRQIRDVHALSVSPALAAWNTGRTYSRPICRRIVESAGVPRHAFGQRKRAASVLFNDVDCPLTPGSAGEFLAWLREREVESRTGQAPAPLAAMGRRSLVQRTCTTAAELLRATNGGNDLTRRIAGRLAYHGGREPLFRYLFPWAVERAAQSYLSAQHN